MRLILGFVLFVAVSAFGQTPLDAADPFGNACYRVGEPIIMRFSYSGTKTDWDASFYFDVESDPPLISKGARAVFVISKGTGPFESRVTKDRDHYKLWELLEAPRGKVVVPKNKEFGGNAAYTAIANQPFDFVVDLSEFFELEEPGVYTLVWGCRPQYLQEIIFEVIP